jgi:hypothetical protein
MSNPPIASSIPAEEQLAYQGGMFINFLNSTFQWVDIKLFALPRDLNNDRGALGLLLRHVRYRDSYAGTGDIDMVDLHGPYRLDAITADSFPSADPAGAEAKLRAWAEQNAPLPDIARDQIETELYPRIRNATSCYRLEDLGVAAQHDWGDTVGLNGFHEFVVIDRAEGTLALVVASDD